MVGLQGTLYLVGTPIGNLDDLSARAAKTLTEVDFIAAEDTRVTLKLLNHLGLKKPLVSYFEHNTAKRGEEILARLLAGESCALVTDAGMPAISDPGEKLVALCAENGVRAEVVPGPCAAVSALALSGLPTGRFCFEGFLSVASKSRRERLEAIRQEERTLVFYEAPHKLRATLRDLYHALGERRVSLSREMTKVHEETLRTTLSGACAFYETQEPRGEYVLVVQGAEPQTGDSAELEAQAERLVADHMAQGQSHADAVRAVSAQTGVGRSALYQRTMDKKGGKPDTERDGAHA